MRDANTDIACALFLCCERPQDGRSQHKNKAQAMSVLASRILDAQQQAQQKEQASTRKELVGSGDRSQRQYTTMWQQVRQLSSHWVFCSDFLSCSPVKLWLDFLLIETFA
jgi:protein subunit release factor B